MCDEIILAEELAACEARLAGQAPRPPAINRDQLMYDSGWAACEAELGRGALTTSFAMPRPRLALAWSVTSTAIAASLAVVVALQYRSAATPDMAANAPAPEVLVSKSTDEPAASRQAIMSSIEPALEVNARSLDSGLLGLRRRALMDIWPEPANVSTVSATSAEPAAKTSRELLQELLPAESAGSFKLLWPGSFRTGDSI